MRKRLRRVARGRRPAALVAALAAPAAAQLAPIPQDRGANGLGLALRRLGVTAARPLRHRASRRREQRGAGAPLARPGRPHRAADPDPRRRRPERASAPSCSRPSASCAPRSWPPSTATTGSSSTSAAPTTSATRSASRRPSRSGAARPRWATSCASCASFRPDVVITLPLEAPGGGQHHQAAAPPRARGLPRRRRSRALPGARACRRGRRARSTRAAWAAARARRARAPTVTVRTGVYDPLLGMTWQQLGSVARGAHRSQGAAQLVAPPVEGEASFVLLDSEPRRRRPRGGRPRRPRPLASPASCASRPTTQRRRPSCAPDLAGAPGAGGRRARRLRPRRAREDAALAAGGAGRRARARGAGRAAAASMRGPATELVDRLDDEARDVEAALRLAHGLELEVAGRRRRGRARAVLHRDRRASPTWARRRSPLEEVTLRARRGLDASGPWRAGDAVPRELGRGESVDRPPRGDGARGRGPVAAVLAARPRAPTASSSSIPRWPARPWAPARRRRPSSATAAARPRRRVEPSPRTGGTSGREGARSRRSSPSGSEFSVRAAARGHGRPPSAAARPASSASRCATSARAPAAGRVRLEVPAGLDGGARARRRCASATRARRWRRGSPSRRGAGGAGEAAVRAVFVDEGGREFAAGDQVIAYEHIHERRLVRPAAARVRGPRRRGRPGHRRRATWTGAGDEVDTAIRQLGVPLTLPDRRRPRLRRPVAVLHHRHRHPRLRDAPRPALVPSPPDELRRGRAATSSCSTTGWTSTSASAATRPRRPPPPPPDSPYAPYPAAVTSDRVTDEDAAAARSCAPTRRCSPRPTASAPPTGRAGCRSAGLNFLDARDPRYDEHRRLYRSLPVEPRREARRAGRRAGRPGPVDVRRPRAVPAAPGRSAGGLPAARQHRGPPPGR